VAATMRFSEVLYRLGYTHRVLGTVDIFDRRFIDKVHPEPPHYDMPLSESLLHMKEQQ
jgi:hypothetical protein